MGREVTEAMVYDRTLKPHDGGVPVSWLAKLPYAGATRSNHFVRGTVTGVNSRST
jgi:hypothetical protein